LPVYILNDSQAAAMGEYTYGQEHPPDSSLIVINARHGIGAGIVIRGQLFHGDGGGAGEIGHVVAVQENGALCRCGNRGCLETVASAEALVKKIKSIYKHTSLSNQVKSPNEISLNLICEAFENNDPIIRQVVLKTGQFMGLAIANLVGSLNIQKIVITGDMTCFGIPWMEEIQAIFSKLYFHGSSG
jgi:predicted NBD/HSP70 family sugar kinase